MAATNTDISGDINRQSRDRGLNASLRVCGAFRAVDSLSEEDSDGFSHLKNGATVGHLGSCIELPLAARTDPGGMRTRCGTKHSISASDITAVSSAVSACAINSVAERAACLCRKYLTPDPER